MLPQEAGGMVVELPLEADGLELLLEAGGVELPHPGRPAHRHLPPTLAVWASCCMGEQRNQLVEVVAAVLLSPAALAVGGRVEAHRALLSAVGKVPRPTHHPGRGADSDHRLEGGQGLQSKVLLLPTASFPPPLDHQSMTLPYLKSSWREMSSQPSK